MSQPQFLSIYLSPFVAATGAAEFSLSHVAPEIHEETAKAIAEVADRVWLESRGEYLVFLRVLVGALPY